MQWSLIERRSSSIIIHVFGSTFYLEYNKVNSFDFDFSQGDCDKWRPFVACMDNVFLVWKLWYFNKFVDHL